MSIQPKEQQLPSRIRPKRDSSRGLIILLTALIVLAVILYKQLEPKGQNEQRTVAAAVTDSPKSMTTQENASSSTSLGSTIPNEPLKLFDKDIMLAEDQYQYIMLDLNEKTNHLSYEYQMNSGPNLDFYLVDEDGLFKWKRMVTDGAQESEFMTFSDFDSSTTSRDYKEGNLPAGRYYLIIDNTDYGGTTPPMNFVDDVATLHLTIVGSES